MHSKLLSFFIGILLALNSAFAEKNNSHIYLEKVNHADDMLKYWTPEKINQAKSLQSSKLSYLVKEQTTYPQNPAKIVSSNGVPPTLSISSLEEQLNPPGNSKGSIKTAKHNTASNPKVVGTLHMDFTSSRLVPESANTVYPYLTIGKLYFTIPHQGNFTCSASVLNNRIIITAGHCVHSGLDGKNGFYKNFMFIPAYHKGKAPVGRWYGRYVAVHAHWANGGGIIPNEADFGMIELKDRHVDGVYKQISQYTGHLGYRTESLDRNHAHLLGYPNNLDSGQQMHQVSGETGRTVTAKNVEYGSDMREGSDGSPWVQNFGEQGEGEVPGPNAGINQILGVVSYFYEDPNKMAEGGSGLDNRFLTLLNKMCGHKVGNCT